MLRPDAPPLDSALAQRWHRAGWRRPLIAMLVATWLVALLTTVIATDLTSAWIFATPVLLLWSPWLGCLFGMVAGALAGIVFGVHAALCGYVLIILWRRLRAQRAVVASVAGEVTIDLPDDLVTTSRRPNVIGGRVAARLVTRPRPAVAMLVRAETTGRATLMTADLATVASFPVTEVMHRPDVDDPLRSLGRPLEERTRSAPRPATVVGDLRLGGWVVVVTENCLLVPSGPVRDDWEPPITVPATLVDGRRWSGL